MREIGHFIGGKPVAGSSGRFADVFNPATGEVSGASRWPARPRSTRAVQAAAGRVAGLGRDPAAAPRARDVHASSELLERDHDQLAAH